jgi:hypothetical protein
MELNEITACATVQSMEKRIYLEGKGAYVCMICEDVDTDVCFSARYYLKKSDLCGDGESIIFIDDIPKEGDRVFLFHDSKDIIATRTKNETRQ